MRFAEDDLSICLTVSKGIDHNLIFDVLGVDRLEVSQQSFGDVARRDSLPGQKGALHVFHESDMDKDDLLVTLENNGFMGVSRSAISKLVDITEEDLGHYAAIYRSSGNQGWYRYVEIQDGLVLANFNPVVDMPVPDAVDEFFSAGATVSMDHMIRALEYRMEMTVQDSWLDQQTDTYLIDYRTPRSWKNTRVVSRVRSGSAQR